MHPLLLVLLAFGQTSDDPRSLDPRLEIVQFAASPDIVHPIACDFDKKGRLLVVESHTHFRPKGYNGPPTDRIRMLEDTKGTGKADKFTTFYEGTKFTMDLAVHPIDGSVYVATRNEIFRLRDTKGTGTADEKTRLAFLETKGDYPHNGLSGLCFDSKGDFYFGLGENLGENYTLTGSDGKTHKGGGEGGHIFHMTADGKNLRVVAGGFWNPFGVCRDIYGRIFAVDNDPDSRPPCRLVHVVEGGDYGFQFRYGRGGRHPFQAWNGELPGTLPYVSGVGEAPCEVMAYESDGLPDEYRGDLLVTSWADHRLERYTLEPKGASFVSKTKVVIQGGKDFRPVGLALAPDGSLFLTDWVRRDYNLHGKGAVWHVRWKDHKPAARPTDPLGAMHSQHRPLREAAVRELLTAKDGPRAIVEDFAAIGRSPVPSLARGPMATQLEAMLSMGWDVPPPKDVAFGLEEMLVRETVFRKGPSLDGVDFDVKKLRSGRIRESLAAWNPTTDKDSVRCLDSDDPFIRHAAAWRLAKTPQNLKFVDNIDLKTERSQIARFVSHRLSDSTEDRARIPSYLGSPIEDIRFLTAKWIADEQLRDYYPNLKKAIEDPKLNTRLYLAYATAMARCDNRPVNENQLADIFLQRARSDKTPDEQRVQALRLIPSTYGGLTPDLLDGWAKTGSPVLKLEAVRALSEHPSPKRFAILGDLMKTADPPLMREVLAGLADKAADHLDTLLPLADSAELGDDVLRDFVGVNLPDPAKRRLESLGQASADKKALVDRILGRPVRIDAPKATDTAAWLKRLEGPADIEAGRRVFFHSKLAGCYKCHRADGRGRDIGPDLSTIGQRPRQFLLESILEPSKEVGPSFQTWQIETNDGRVRSGLLVHTNLDEYDYVDDKGERFRVNTRDVAEIRGVTNSIMPDGLVDRLTDRELRDLLAFLEAKK